MTNSTTQPQGDSVSPLRGEEDHAYLLGRERDAELCGQEVKGSVQAGNMGGLHWAVAGQIRAGLSAFRASKPGFVLPRSPNSQQRHLPQFLPGACSVSRSCGSSLSLNFSSGLGNFP